MTLRRNRFLIVAGTRPELIKQAPIVRRLRGDDACFCWVTQHRDLVSGMFTELGIWPDVVLALPRVSSTLRQQRAQIKAMIEDTIRRLRPCMAIVQGDTTTAYAAAIASAANHTAVAHVEAGLRSNHIRMPWPEELYRRAISKVASIHFAPTALSRKNLLEEGVSADRIWVTGNTGIDSLVAAMDPDYQSSSKSCSSAINRLLKVDHPFVLATIHRREAFDTALDAVIRALVHVAARKVASVVFVRHSNPLQASALDRGVAACPDLIAIPPLPYREFIALLSRAHAVVTDSGGVIEEATALGVPVLIARTAFERQEALGRDTVRLVSPNSPDLLPELLKMISGARTKRRTRLANVTFGDGQAASRIANILYSYRTRLASDYRAVDRYLDAS